MTVNGQLGRPVMSAWLASACAFSAAHGVLPTPIARGSAQGARAFPSAGPLYQPGCAGAIASGSCNDGPASRRDS